MGRHWDENPKVLVFYSQWGLFAITLPFTTKQYKVDNIANFVYYGKTRMSGVSRTESMQHSIHVMIFVNTKNTTIEFSHNTQSWQC